MNLNLPPPLNSNQALDPRHVLYVATTGGGKTTAIKKLGQIPKGAQAIFFDPYENYAGKKFQGQMVVKYTEFMPFLKALVSARKKVKKGGFKIALVKPPTHENLEIFSQIAWSMGDGLKPELHVCIEELATACDTVGKLKGTAGELWRGGRQYGLIVHSAFQRMQEVPKTVINNTPIWWVGSPNSINDVNYIAKAKGVDPELITSLKIPKVNNGMADYLLISDGFGNIEQGQINCKS
ncbi:hypothetical protein [Vibrio nigripulchritudo]|uniref:hypothetical protein n=1 Tax=Vibrio nigripulchritudo TaxID=28173 RepID=UPI002490C675|nr:hypothetical protein [Vibrio nigripulchritudo]BDU42889.1 hypothetical protein TUMSATVNIG3_16870 [Vibrio nigripulchritudo]